MQQSLEKNKPAFFVGIDWADQKHDVYILDSKGQGWHEEIGSAPEDIRQWVLKMRDKAGDQPIAIILEQSRGSLIYALMNYEDVILFPINPRQFVAYRQSYSSSDCKADVSDARLMSRMLRERISVLRPWELDDKETRLLSQLCQQRRKLVDEHTRTRQQLISALKQYFPLVLTLWKSKQYEALLLEVLRRWPEPKQLKRADRQLLDRVLRKYGIKKQQKRNQMIESIRSMVMLTGDEAIVVPLAIVTKTLATTLGILNESVAKFDANIQEQLRKHPDAPLFTGLRGAGSVLAPRLLTAFGSRRDRWESADEIAILSGIAPVTRKSGNSRQVYRRFKCPKYLRQTFHEFADHASRWCPWSKAVYKFLRKEKNMKHHAALRKIARSWIRILFRVWKTNTPYDAQKYIETLVRKRPEIRKYLPSHTRNT